jgi:DUF4097 and DUF4098 domain-containing protein YvlB
MISEMFETAGAVALDIRCAAGEVVVEASESSSTHVEVDAAAELLEATRVEARQVGERHEVVVDVPRRTGFLRRNADAHVTVRAPEGADVRIDAASADTRAHGRLGSVYVTAASGDVELADVATATIRTASGDVQVDDVGADASVNTASGDVTIGRVGGEANVKSASGDVSLREARGDVGISTASGDQTLGAVAGGRVELRSASGDIHVGIAQGSGVWVDARSLSGDTTSELELGTAEPAPDEDGPIVELNAMSMSGDVRIVRA